MKRYLGALALFLLLTPEAGYTASKEQQEMQRDIAQLQDQVRMLQSGFDQKMATLQTLIQEALEAGNKANTAARAKPLIKVMRPENFMKRSFRERENLSRCVTVIAGLGGQVLSEGDPAAELGSRL